MTDFRFETNTDPAECGLQMAAEYEREKQRAEAAERRVADLEVMLQGCRNVLDLLRRVVSKNKVSRFDCVEGRDGSLVNVAATIAKIDALTQPESDHG